MNKFIEFYRSSIGKKQIVAVTGLLLIGFLIVHLAGNLLLLLGPKAFNAYAEKLAHLRPGLYLVEFSLLIVFFIHIFITAQIVLENIQARSQRYALYHPEERSWASKLMPYTGTIILAFVIWHLLDFTFVDKEGLRSILADGKSYGLYGVVYNAFSDPKHSALYIIVMFAVGFHLSHGAQSFAQTFGISHSESSCKIKYLSEFFGLIIALGYSFIPVWVLMNNVR